MLILADTELTRRLRGLVLSAVELKNMTGWPSELVEDYLNLIDNIIEIASTVDVSLNADIQTVTENYTTVSADGVILVDASLNSVTITLDDAAETGQEHEIKCVNDDNDVFISPNGKTLDDSLGDFQIFLHESVSVKADSENNWWIK